MRLKSTNIWDDIRKEIGEERFSGARVGSHRLQPSVRRGSFAMEDPGKSDLGNAITHHANRHGISMKSLMKNR